MELPIPSMGRLDLDCHMAVLRFEQHIDFAASVGRPIVQRIVEILIGNLGAEFIDNKGLKQGAEFFLRRWIGESAAQ